MSSAWAGGDVTSRATCVLAPNPGALTLEGTNTWVLMEPGSSQCVVVDPGPLDERHLQHVLRVVASHGARVSLTLLTHSHPDHAESGRRFGELTGAPVRAIGVGGEGLCDGDRLAVDGLELAVLATPGHTGDSLSFLLAAENALLTGDTILGRGTAMVAWPDGELAAYLTSLQRIEAMTGSREVTQILPGHGPTVSDPGAVVRYYLDHRQERLEQVRAAVALRGGFDSPDSPDGADGADRADGADGADRVNRADRVDGVDGVDGADRAGRVDVDAVVKEVYADVPPELWPAARLSVLSQLEYLSIHP